MFFLLEKQKAYRNLKNNKTLKLTVKNFIIFFLLINLNVDK